MNLLVFATLVVVALAGCNATMPQQAKRPAASDDPSNACFNGLASDSRLRVLVPRIGAINRADQASIDMMASKESPSEQERLALKIWTVARQTCVEMGADFRKAYAPPQYQGIIEAYNAPLMMAIAKLYAGDINYGQFIAERQRLAAESQARWNGARQSERQDSVAAQQAQAAMRAQSAAELNNAMMLMQAAQPRPASPSAPTNCTSRMIGNTVNTDCR